jgi:hypothetical protein
MRPTRQSAIGQTLVLLVLRKPSHTWQLLVASRDPLSNGRFWDQAGGLAAGLTSREGTSALPVAATLLSPEDSHSPKRERGQRFGTFEWQSSPSADVFVEIVEFAYEDDARLFFARRTAPEARLQLSAGELWTTGSTWTWRVWSLTRSGDIALSTAWTFPH